MATPSQPLSALALQQSLRAAADRATGAAQAAQDAARRLQATGTAFQAAEPATGPQQAPQGAQRP